MTSKWGYTSPEVRLGSHHGTGRTKLVRLVEPGSKNDFLKGKSCCYILLFPRSIYRVAYLSRNVIQKALSKALFACSHDPVHTWFFFLLLSVFCCVLSSSTT